MAELIYMSDAEFKENFDFLVKQINDILKSFLPEDITLQKTIYNAFEYSLMGGGKRLRSMIIHEVFSLFGGSGDAVFTFMAAIEMIHAYSLVHDDLPAMDNDEYRRGKKTTHVVYGEDMGILTGDVLLNYAYETIAKSMTNGDISSQVRAFNILSKKAGIHGMAGGQVVDVEKTGKPLNEEELEFIYRLKTCALIEASFMIGAVLAGADEVYISDMENIGYNVGMAFQIQDDILDLTGTDEELGKPTHSDEKNCKSTYAVMYGIDKAAKAVKMYSEQALEILGKLPTQNTYLNTLIRMLISRRK